ncbi:ImmA/IrrE family metallo-endopeptidase [bacterium]|nr:ImmA/IrrE family metallo-endopeptidase [bacterium]
MNIKVIKTQKEYETALEQLEDLLDKNPSKDSTDAYKLELLSLLVKDYEEKKFAFEDPNPIEAIKFRMEQENLSPRDLIPYIGNRSKVSEILSGKRTLTLSMIRALHTGLGIPLDSLVGQKGNLESINWEKFPIKEMKKRGWIDNISKSAEQIISSFLQPIEQQLAVPTLLRQTNHIRSAKEMDKCALIIWKAHIIMQAKKMRGKSCYKPGIITEDFFKRLVQLSTKNNSPVLAQDFLKKHGIILVIEPHFSKTYLDGAAIMTNDGPIIGLTLRYDRLDNFWFCLIHELAHLKLHLKNEDDIIYDDLESDAGNDPLETEADSLTSETLIPLSVWKKNPASRLKSPAAAKGLARKLEIAVAIVAGYMRHKFNNYRILNNLIGNKEVRKHFPYAKWRAK